MGQAFRYRVGQIVPGTGLKIVRPLGSGGMGAVYEVEETSVEAPFVMKVVHPHLLLPGSHAAERMRQEARTQARLNHRNIVRVYRAGVTAESPPLPYYVMDRLSGYTVRQVLRWHATKGGFVPMGWAFWVAASVLQALEHAHKNGVVHRDVKPDNIFVHHEEGHQPLTKLLDFGIVAAFSELSDKTRLTAGGFAGTYTHAAPEQLQGAKPAPTMDIYSLGMVLFEMLAGRRPFDDRKTPEEVIYAQLHESPPPISRTGVHPRLRALVARMLAKDPAQRPQSAQTALGELLQIKTEWMQQRTDISVGDSVDFELDVDLGERWPTNFDVLGDSSAQSQSDDRRDSRRSGPDSNGSSVLARVPPLALDEPSTGQSSVPTRSSWWSTVDRYKARLRVSHVVASAAAFAALAGFGSWFFVTRADAPRSPSVSPAPPTEPQQVNTRATAPPPAEVTSEGSPAPAIPVAPTFPPEITELKPPVPASSPPVSSAMKPFQRGVAENPRTDHALPLARPAAARQSPSQATPASSAQTGTSVDPMLP